MPAVRFALSTERGRVRLSLAYSVVAALLVPWIVGLFATQRFTATAHHLVLVSVGVPVAFIAGLLAAAWLYARHSPHVAATAGFTAAAIGVTEWFHLLSGASPVQVSTVVILVFLLLVIGLLSVVAVGSLDGTGVSAARRRSIAWLLVAAAVVIGASVVQLAADIDPVHRVRHLRLVWTGLDVFEFAGLAATAWGLRTGASRTALAASATGALLLSDAWYNIAASTGAGQLQAIVMGFVEVPIAVVSFAIGWYEAGRVAAAAAAPAV